MFLKIQLACVGFVVIWKYLILGLCDSIDPFVTIVLHDWLMASHKWWYFLKSIIYLYIHIYLFLILERIKKCEIIWNILYSFENKKIMDLYQSLMHTKSLEKQKNQILHLYQLFSLRFQGGGLTAWKGRSDRVPWVFYFVPLLVNIQCNPINLLLFHWQPLSPFSRTAPTPSHKLSPPPMAT